MKVRLAIGLLSLLLTQVLGCVGGGPQLSFSRGSQLGEPGGSPSGSPGGVPPGGVSDEAPTDESPIAGFLPELSTNQILSASGSAFYESEKYRAYGSTASSFGGRSQGEIYQMVSPEMAMGQKRLRE